MDFDTAYASSGAYFGERPERTLLRHAHLLDPSLPVLDLGCGQGRNTLWLARKGFRVEAVDPSAEAIRAVKDTCRNEALQVVCRRSTFQALAIGMFGGVLAFGLIPILERRQIELLTGRIRAWTAPGGLAWLTAFTTRDPAYPALVRQASCIGRGSFRRADGTVRTYLDPGELRGAFGGWEILHTWEGLGPEHRHGNGPLERHALAELVVRRPRPGC
jgi:2-polyprenyl-3-methyl-5-hydroxy-6-metoxy-1,4-benzoquinol methylase